MPGTFRSLATPFTFPVSGKTAANRFAKGAMTESLANAYDNEPSQEHVNAYRTWGEGGTGLILSGNIMIDSRYLENPRNVVLEDDHALEKFKVWVTETKKDGALFVAQISHPGRQSPFSVTSQPICPSESQVRLKSAPPFFRTARAMTDEDYEEVTQRFVNTAKLAKEAGFDGVQLHAAHGYLLSQSLNPLVNKRTDKWGGSLDNRMRLLLQVVKRTREAVGKDFIVGIKLNTSDFQKGGFSEEDSTNVVKALEVTNSLDFVELSGGTYESAAMMGAAGVRESTRKREAFFLDYAQKIKQVTKLPVMLTGGFRSAPAMEEAVKSGIVDMIGIARPLVMYPDAPKQIFEGKRDTLDLPDFTNLTGVKDVDGLLDPMLNNVWYGAQIWRLGQNLPVDPQMGWKWLATEAPLRNYGLDWQRYFGFLVGPKPIKVGEN
eukprot:Clim_evm8s156 gene=Clim_evmTU8s156